MSFAHLPSRKTLSVQSPAGAPASLRRCSRRFFTASALALSCSVAPVSSATAVTARSFRRTAPTDPISSLMRIAGYLSTAAQLRLSKNSSLSSQTAARRARCPCEDLMHTRCSLRSKRQYRMVSAADRTAGIVSQLLPGPCSWCLWAGGRRRKRKSTETARNNRDRTHDDGMAVAHTLSAARFGESRPQEGLSLLNGRLKKESRWRRREA